MNDFWKDARYAARVLAKSPGFTLVVVLSLALGIGANTAIFSLVNAYFLRPMPVDDPDRLVAVYLTSPRRWGRDIGNFSYPDLSDYRRADPGFSDLMGSSGLPLSMTGGEKPELIWGEIVTGNYFSGLGVHPVLGRGFLPEEDRAPGEHPVCVLNYNFWRKQFQSDPNIAGKSIRINGHPFMIVGVAPRGFIGTRLFTFVPDVWVPLAMQQTIAPDYGNRREGRGAPASQPVSANQPGYSGQHDSRWNQNPARARGSRADLGHHGDHVRRGGSRSRDRVHQRGESHAGPRGWACQGDGHSRCCGRYTGSPGAPVTHRKPAAVAARSRCGNPAGIEFQRSVKGFL